VTILITMLLFTKLFTEIMNILKEVSNLMILVVWIAALRGLILKSRIVSLT